MATLSSHPRYALAWAQKLQFWATSEPAEETDPELLRIANVFSTSNFNFNALALEVFTSPLVTFAAPTQTLTDNGIINSISRRDHWCAALSNRLGIPDICGQITPMPTNAQQTVASRASLLAVDAYYRAYAIPSLATNPDLFFRATVEDICGVIASEVIDDNTDAGPSRYSSTNPTAAITDMVNNVMGLPPSDPRAAEATSILTNHLNTAPLEDGRRVRFAGAPVHLRARLHLPFFCPPRALGKPRWISPNASSSRRPSSALPASVSVRSRPVCRSVSSASSSTRALPAPTRPTTRADGAVPACIASQYLILFNSGSGDPLNANVPGTYDDPDVYHSPDPRMAKTAMTVGGKATSGAAAWAGMTPEILGRTGFFHHGTYTNAHGDVAKVNRIMGSLQRQEMLISFISKTLTTCLGPGGDAGVGGTVQPSPVCLANDLITFNGAVVSPLNPQNLQAVLTGPGSPLLANLQSLRDKDLDSLNAMFQKTGTASQRALLDQYASSQSQVRNINQQILSDLGKITGNQRTDYNIAAAVLIRLNVSPPRWSCRSTSAATTTATPGSPARRSRPSRASGRSRICTVASRRTACRTT